MRRTFFFVLILLILATAAFAGDSPSIPEIDRVRIAEVYRIGEKLQDQVWSGWSSAPFSMLFVTDDYEFLIRHPKPNDEFKSIGYDKLLKSEVFFRPRKFQKSFLATFPVFDRQPVIVIGKAENTSDKTSTRWIFVALHEHFHQLQYSRPDYFSEVDGLNLANGDTSGMWQINYPFPYKLPDVASKFKELTSLLLNLYGSIDKPDSSEMLRSFLHEREKFFASLSDGDRKYASFQLWQEGIARYTQYKMAKLAAQELKPSKRFRKLKDFTSFDVEATRILNMTTDEMQKLDLPTWERVVFYPFGALEGLVLDKYDPKWHEVYFSEKFALEKYYNEANR